MRLEQRDIRELQLVIANAALMALSDAIEAAEQARSGEFESTIPIPAKLIRELLGNSWIDASTSSSAAPLDVERRAQLKDVARDLERALFARLYDATGGDFVAMARRLLSGDAETNARRVRLRFNQLGLRVRSAAKK